MFVHVIEIELTLGVLTVLIVPFPGAQIIDLMMLVVDVTKGIQTQTAECLVIGEILCEKMIVVLNKIDLLAEDKRTTTVEKVNNLMQIQLQLLMFLEEEYMYIFYNRIMLIYLPF